MTNVIELDLKYWSVNTDSNQEIKSVTDVDHSISYSEFFHNFLLKNKPCIFQSNITDNWLSRHQWRLNEAPNFEFLKKSFGNCVAPVANCKKKYFNSQYKEQMTINEYIDYWIDYRNCSDSVNKPLLYLKDWHCVKHYPNTSFYEVPKFFSSDWLNEYYISHSHLRDDYMFVYMGPKGTWTPFHVDVFTSYSWSANICGRKRWLLFPPGQENYFRDVHGELIYDVTCEEIHDSSKYKNYHSECIQCFEVIQEAGQIIFVPSGWHHQVWNLEDTISINHNWINACNIWNMWAALKKELVKVMKEIEDCKDMDDWLKHCQLMLKASYGIDYVQFFEFMSYIAERRLNCITNQVPVVNFKVWQQDLSHCIFDLQQLKIVLDDLAKDVEEKAIALIFNGDEISALSNKISKVL